MPMRVLLKVLIVSLVVLGGCDTEKPARESKANKVEETLMTTDPETLYEQLAEDVADPDVDPKEALRGVNRLLELAPNMGAAYSLRGMLHKDLSRGNDGRPTNREYIQLAIDDFTKAFKNGYGYQALYSRGLMWYSLEAWEKAIADFTDVIENVPSSDIDGIHSAYSARAHAYEMKGTYALAIQDYNALIEYQKSQGRHDVVEHLERHVDDLKSKN